VKTYKQWFALLMAFMMLLAMGCAAPAAAPAESVALPSEVPAEATPAPTEAPVYEGTLEERMTAEQAALLAQLEKEWKAEFQDTPITTEMTTCYLLSPDTSFELELAFLEAYDDVPFMDLEYFVNEVMCDLGAMFDENYGLTVEAEGSTITLTRDNGSVAIFDFEENSIYFDNLYYFWKLPYRSAGIDSLSATGFNAEGEPEYFQRTGAVFERTGRPIMIDMDKRYIPLLFRDGKGYVPLQTLCDLLLINLNFNILYNGQELFIVAGSGLGTLSEQYYSVGKSERSEAMASYNFSELCLALDLYYGLADAHEIDSFQDFFMETGLYEDLLSPDGAVYSQALYKLAYGYLADGHTNMVAPSHYVGTEAALDPLIQGGYSPALLDNLYNKARYAEARLEAYPEGMPGYEEIGNTAYVTFDMFLMAQQDYYSEPATADAMDTVGLVSYAHSQIMREGSPIENVVIDLSNNGGGQADAAIYVMGWFLGSCNLNFVDTINGGQSSVQYMVDVNLDRAFDENDSVSSKNLYCIISPKSFSCGNLVPATFKSSGKVTLLGQPSSGGACVVMQGSTADGTLFSYSSNQRLSTVLNGAYTDVDGGVEPDIPITKIDSFYDREFLTDYINDLP